MPCQEQKLLRLNRNTTLDLTLAYIQGFNSQISGEIDREARAACSSWDAMVCVPSFSGQAHKPYLFRSVKTQTEVLDPWKFLNLLTWAYRQPGLASPHGITIQLRFAKLYLMHFWLFQQALNKFVWTSRAEFVVLASLVVASAVTTLIINSNTS